MQIYWANLHMNGIHKVQEHSLGTKHTKMVREKRDEKPLSSSIFTCELTWNRFDIEYCERNFISPYPSIASLCRLHNFIFNRFCRQFNHKIIKVHKKWPLIKTRSKICWPRERERLKPVSPQTLRYLCSDSGFIDSLIWNSMRTFCFVCTK